MDPLTFERPTGSPGTRTALIVLVATCALTLLVPPFGTFGLLPLCSVGLVVAGWLVLGPENDRTVLTAALLVAAGVCGTAGVGLDPGLLVRYQIVIGFQFALLVLLGRPVIGGVGFVVAAVAMVITVAVRAGTTFAAALPLSLPLTYGLTGVTAVVICGWTSVVLRRLGRQMERDMAERTAAATREAVAHEKQSARRSELARAYALAEPLLVRAAAGTLTAQDRQSARLVEATLRDRVRARRLCDPALTAAVTAARARGVEVDLYDDGPPDEVLPADLLDGLVGRVAASGPGDRISVRLDPPGRGRVGSFLLDRADGTGDRRSL